MTQDDSTSLDVTNLESYTDYQTALERFLNKGFIRQGFRPESRGIDDLTNEGYTVVRIQHYDDDTLLPKPGVMDILVRKLEK